MLVRARFFNNLNRIPHYRFFKPPEFDPAKDYY